MTDIEWTEFFAEETKESEKEPEKELDLDWNKHNNPVYVLSFFQNSPELKLKMINILTKIKNDFFMVVNSHDEVTIVVDSKADIFTDCDYRQTYIAYNLINTKTLLDESGLVKKIATMLDEQEIPIMYTTTFNNNYLFVPIEYEEKTDRLLNI